MRNRCLLGAGVALAVLFGCAQANAQLLMMPSGPGAWYFGGEGGWTHLNNQTDSVAGALPAHGASLTTNFDEGFNVGARAGYQWGPWRFEEEYSFRWNKASSLGGFSAAAINGNRQAHAIMTNVIYDFTLGWPITPHLGVGVGAVDVVDGVSTNTGVPAAVFGVAIPPGSLLKGSGWEFGYQAIAGFEYNINPALAFDLDYRYLATSDPTFSNKASAAVTALLPSYKTGYDTHNVVASLILRFGPPPPVVPPAAAPAPPPPPRQVYLVFFDWDKYNITPQGLQIIQQAAAQWRAGGMVKLQVTGYTDLSGSPGYNQRLSERRAAAVAGALEKFGVPRSDMAVIGRGENDPRVPTAKGVREPQNRRVEIVFP